MMTETGHGVQVVDVTDDHSYFLDVMELKGILMRDEIKDLPVVVVSLAGAYRGGKSFMLNFFLRYLRSSVSARADGTWLGDDSEPLEGFSWRGGSKRNTTGILLWSEPIVTSLSTGEKVAVLLMDTQGTFDNKSTVRDCSTIFALSTLVSSVQVYNLPGGSIQEDDLQHLQLFTEYGKLINEQQDGGKAFQVLEFLVRDWGSDFEYAYGNAGGQQYLDELLKIVPGQAKELSDLRRHIHASFETVSCFLMPHPGLKIMRTDFKGRINELEPDFVVALKELASSIFGPDKLKVKMINGQPIKARQLFTYFNSYMGIFNSNKIPTPTSIMKVTVEAGLLVAVNAAREQYEAGMDVVCGDNAPSVSAVDLKAIHTRELNAAKATFNSIKKMGSNEDVELYLGKLIEDINKHLPQYMSMNIVKTQKAIDEAKEAYEKTIFKLSGDKPVCVHPIDLKQVHDEAFAAAVKVFDAKRKRSLTKDAERKTFIEGFENRYSLLRLANQQNNKTAVFDLRMEYWEYMEGQGAIDPPLSSSEFEDKHRSARARALDAFKENRNRPDSYTEDIFKTSLTTEINRAFEQLKLIIQSKNKIALEAAIAAYNKHMSAVKPRNNKCLHPDDLEREHESAKCHALLAIRPRKTCSDGFDPSDEDETTLLETLRQRYAELSDINNAANQTAVQEAFNRYVSLMEDRCRPNMSWLLIYPIVDYITNNNKYHEENKAKALELFYSKRIGGGYHGADVYVDNLEQMMNGALKNYQINLPAIISTFTGLSKVIGAVGV